MPQHPLSRTTRTLDMQQLAELEEHLHRPGAQPVTAGEAGVEAAGLPPDARLVHLEWDGPPEFPYIHGDFAAGGPAPRRLPLHTAHLVWLSHRFGLRHRWGS